MATNKLDQVTLGFPSKWKVRFANGFHRQASLIKWSEDLGNTIHLMKLPGIGVKKRTKKNLQIHPLVCPVQPINPLVTEQEGRGIIARVTVALPFGSKNP
jgi:hypothetical protein